MEKTSPVRAQTQGVFNHETLWNLGIATLVFSALAVVLFRTAADPDLWGHLRFGLDNLQAGKIIQVDPYSYVTTGQRWINHEWLSEVLFALAWNAFGSPGLIFLKVCVGSLTVGILYGYLRWGKKLSPLHSLILVLLGSLPLIPFLFHVRPQMFTYLLFTIILLIIMKVEQGDERWLYAAPLVIALWANLHGGVLAGLGLLSIWAAVHLLISRRRWPRVVFMVLASIAATLFNPYGADLLLFLLRTATVARPEIEDWQPLALISPLGMMYLFILASSVIGMIFSTRAKKPGPLFLFGLVALLPWIAMRHLPLFSIAVVILAGEHITAAWNRIQPVQGQAKPVPFWISGLLFVGSAALFAGGSRLDLFHIHVIDKEKPPVAAVDLLKQSGVSGNLATEFSWGEYVIWHLGPSVKVSIDGRRETVYSPEVYQQNILFLFGAGPWDAILVKHPTDMALVKKNAPNDNLLRLLPEWSLIFEDEQSALYAKRTSDTAKQLEETTSIYSPAAGSPYFP